MSVKVKNRSLRCDINRTRPRNSYECTKYKICLSMIMVMCSKPIPKQYLKLNS